MAWARQVAVSTQGHSQAGEGLAGIQRGSVPKVQEKDQEPYRCLTESLQRPRIYDLNSPRN